MRVLVTGHNGFIGRNVYLDWQQTLGVNNVDGIDYPDTCLAKDKKYGTIDFFWRIPNEKRESVGEPSPWVLRVRRIFERTRDEGPDGIMSQYVDNSYMWEPGFKFDWED